MRMKRNVLGVLVLVALAFAVGRMDGFAGTGSLASASPADTKKKVRQDHPTAQQEMEMDPEMLAMMAAGTPGEFHKHLDQLIGEWQGTFKIWMTPGGEPMVSIGSVSRKWVLGGRYLYEEIDSKSDFGDFHGIGYVGYNNIDGQYESIWMDDMSTMIYFAPGSYDPDTKIMKMRGSYRDPATGKLIASRGVMDLSDPGRHTYVAYNTGPDGKEYKSMEGVTERVK